MTSDQKRKLAALLREKAAADETKKVENTAHTVRALLGLTRLSSSMGK